MKKSTLSNILGLGFFLATIVIIAVIYFNAIQKDDQSLLSTFTGPADIVSLSSEAKELTSGRENNAAIPIPVPTNKMGKSNPLSDPE